MRKIRFAVLIFFVFLQTLAAISQTKQRARDLGVPFDGTPGPNNAITDVKGVEVGHTTLIDGDGPLKVGVGPVRTGVTAVLPRGKNSQSPVFAAWFTLNGNGEMTGTTWVEDSGLLDGPVMITNTHSVGVVRDAVIAWKVKRGKPDMEGYWWSLPVVAETWDGYLNDINGFHVKPEHAIQALDTPIADRWKKEALAAAQGWSAMNSKAGLAPRRECSPPKKAATPSAYWCSATTDSATSCGLPGFRWEKKSPMAQSARTTQAQSS